VLTRFERAFEDVGIFEPQGHQHRTTHPSGRSHADNEEKVFNTLTATAF